MMMAVSAEIRMVPLSAEEPSKCIAPVTEADLSLTARQKQALDSLHAFIVSVREENVTKLRFLRAKLKTEMTKLNPDKALISKYLEQLSTLHETNADRWVDHLLRVKAVLTPDQFKIVLEREWRQSRTIDPCRIDEWEMPMLEADE